MSEMKEPRKLRSDAIELAETAVQNWFATAEAGTTIEEVLLPEYWAHIAPRLMPNARITVLDDGDKWMVDLFVRSVSVNGASVVLLNKYDNLVPAKSAAAPARAELWVKYRGRYPKYCVMRKDGSVLESGFETQEAAAGFIASFQGERKAA